MRDIKISAVLGLKTVMVPALVTIISAFSQLPKSLLSELQALGVGVGVIGGFWEAQKHFERT